MKDRKKIRIYQKVLKMYDSLSPREVQILELIISEYTTSEIADELFLSTDTVKTHRKHLLEKMNARNVAGLVRRAFEYNYLSKE